MKKITLSILGCIGLLSGSASAFSFTDWVHIQFQTVDSTLDLVEFQEQLAQAVEQVQQGQQLLDQLGDAGDILDIDLDSILDHFATFEESITLEDILDFEGLNGGLEAIGENALSYTMDGVFNEITSVDIYGNEINRNEEDYRQFGAVEQSVENYRATAEDARNNRSLLAADYQQVMTDIQAATTEAEVLKLSAKKDAIEVGMAAEADRVSEANQSIAAIHTAQEVNAEKQRQADLEEEKTTAAKEAEAALNRDEADIDLYGTSGGNFLPVGPTWAKDN